VQMQTHPLLSSGMSELFGGEDHPHLQMKQKKKAKIERQPKNKQSNI
jgi:hypothetical protein